ncbi:MAG TPA: ATPase domain-containing protein [Anaerolineales bacterium]|nr:ATPase domain-containing protein [Anaerolineales bacterium]
MTPAKRNKPMKFLPKSPTGIPGLDEITDGGLPKGRTTLVAGGAGCDIEVLSRPGEGTRIVLFLPQEGTL